MNRSFHAFAVLLVSLAGGILAATWTSTLPCNRSAMQVRANRQPISTRLHCSCNPESLIRFEEGCARDKTTGELYGCGLGLGENGKCGKSVITSAANNATDFIAKMANGIRDGIAQVPWREIAVQSQRLEKESAAIQLPIPALAAKPQHEQDYAAAELAAAGFAPEKAPEKADSARLSLNEQIAQFSSVISAESIHGSTKVAVRFLRNLNRKWDRQSRLWLVEAGLHQAWDAAEEAILTEERLAGMRLQIDEESFNRWFENFPPPVTQPNRLINPIEPKDDSEESRRIILATAKALETLSGLLHQTAENLARHAEQDVAKLHKLKSGIEERR